MTRAGRLRHRVVIEQDTGAARGAQGSVTASWGTFATRWAAIVPLSGREAFDAQQKFSEATHRIEMRHTAGITPKMRATFDSRTFDIADVQNPEERDRETHLIAAERTT